MLVGVSAAVMAFRLLVFRHPAWLGRRLLQTLDNAGRTTAH